MNHPCIMTSLYPNCLTTQLLDKRIINFLHTRQV